MYIYKLKVTFSNVNFDLVYDVLEKLIDAFYRHGQIIYKDVPRFVNTENISCILNSCEFDSLNKIHHKYYVDKYWKDLEKISKKIDLEFLGSGGIGNTECCNIQDFFILYLDSLYSPIVCGNCLEPIPIYKFPETYEDGKGYDNLFFWRKNYKSCDELWFNGSVLEESCLDQISNINSDLSKEGISVCKSLESLTGKKIYYYLFNTDNKNVCPSCNNKLDVFDKSNEIKYICHKCKIVM